jgi:hypothetical protein
MDMSAYIAPKSDQLNADDLIAGPRTITITSVRGSEGDQPVAVHYDGDNGKPFKPCKSMRRVMVHAWGRDAKQYAGRSMTLYRDPKIKFGGMEVGGIRISHMSHIDGKLQMALTETRGKRAPYVVQPLSDAPQKTQQQPEDPALNWTNGYIARVEAAETAEALDAWVKSKAAKLAELKTARPDLHERAEQAERDRREELAPHTGSFDDDDLSAPSQTAGAYDGA